MAMDILTQQNDPTQSASSISPQEQGTAAGTDNSQPEGTLPEDAKTSDAADAELPHLVSTLPDGPPPAVPPNFPKKNRWILVACVLAALILLAGSACGYFIFHSVQEKRRQAEEASRSASEEAVRIAMEASRSASEEAARQAAEESSRIMAEAKASLRKNYINIANTFDNLLLLTASELEDIGNTILTNWHNFVYNDAFYSIEAAVEAAQEEKASEIAQAKIYKEELDSLYAQFIKISDYDADLAAVRDAVVQLYDAYVDLYHCVINVSGSYTSYSDEFSDCDTAVYEKHVHLDNLLALFKEESQ